MTRTVTTSIFYEIEIVIEGEIEPAEQATGPTADCGGTPGHDAFVNGYEVKAVMMEGVDILSGLTDAAAIRALLGRVHFAVRNSAERALMLEAGE